jgi:hypothetical protein
MTSIGLNLTGLGFLLLVLIGCCANAAPKTERAQLDAIARTCGFPASVLKLERGHLHIQPPAHAPYGKVECLLVATRKAGFHPPIAFVGTETFDPKAR